MARMGALHDALGRRQRSLYLVCSQNKSPLIGSFRCDSADTVAHSRCIGGLPKSSSSTAAYITTTTSLPISAARAFSPLATLERKFRFLYLSTYHADVTESKWRPFEKKSAYLNGRTERALFELTKNHPLQVQYELYTFRPGSVLDWMGEVSGNGFCGKVGRLWVPTVPVRVLAKAMVDVSFIFHGISAIFGMDCSGLSVNRLPLMAIANPASQYSLNTRKFLQRATKPSSERLRKRNRAGRRRNSVNPRNRA